MGFQLLQPPASEPLSVPDAKAYCRIYTSADDAIVGSLITAAREWAEGFTRQKFVTQKWRMLLDAFPGYIDQRLGGNIVVSPIAIGATSYMAGIRWAIVPPYPPVQSIDALTYVAPDSTPVTLTPDVDYLKDITSRPARVTPTFGKFWPISRIQMNAVSLDWTCGYSVANPLPESARIAMMMMVAHWYEHREAFSHEQYYEVPNAAKNLLYKMRDLRIA